MIENAIGFLLLLMGLIAIALQRLYSSVPTHELKRLASRGDGLAATLYRVAAYGASLRLLLWVVACAGLASGLAFLVPPLPFVVGITLLVMVITITSVLLPSLRLTQRSAQFAAWFVPLVNWLLAHTHTLLERFSVLASYFRELPMHSRLYEKQDLLDLFNRQKEQTDNRIAHEDLDLMSRALTFKNIRAIDVAQSRKESHVVNADDAIGPILLDQLHKYHQTSFLVYKDTKENIIGTLAMSDAVTAKHGGRVLDLIRSELIYVHEDFSARQVLTAFHKTGHQIAAVINNAEEFVGTITVDHLLQALLGEVKDDEVAYADRAAIAAYDSSENQVPSESPELAEEQDSPDEEVELSGQENTADISTTSSSPGSTEVVK